MPNNLENLLNRAVQVVVDHHVIESPASLGHMNFTLRGPEPFGDFVRAVAASGLQSLQQCRLIGRQNEDHQCIGILKPHLQGPLDVDFQQNVLSRGQVLEGRVLGRSVIVAINLGIFQELILVEPIEKFVGGNVLVDFPLIITRALGPRGRADDVMQPVFFGEFARWCFCRRPRVRRARPIDRMEGFFGVPCYSMF